MQIAIHPKTGDIFLNFGVTPLISYSLSRSSSFQDKATIFLISLAVIISILGILISLVIYCFLRFRRNLQMATLAAYFQNGKPSLQSVDLMDTNMFEQDRKNSAKSTTRHLCKHKFGRHSVASSSFGSCCCVPW